MCLIARFVLELRPEVKKLLLDVVDRKYFGIGASPRGRPVFIKELQALGLAEYRNFFPSGHPRFALTPCGIRAANFLDDAASHPLALQQLIRDYDAQPCLQETIDYHDYEDWVEP